MNKKNTTVIINCKDIIHLTVYAIVYTIVYTPY